MLSIVACVLLLIGKFGRLDCRDSHRRILEIKSCLAKLPKPTLAWGNQSSLPWNNQNDTNHFVLAAALYTIPVAKREQGGLDGLVASGYFAAVVDLDGSHAAVCEKAMRRADSVACPGVIYLRRENPAVK
jgi:hypothetical protein